MTEEDVEHKVTKLLEIKKIPKKTMRTSDQTEFVTYIDKKLFKLGSRGVNVDEKIKFLNSEIKKAQTEQKAKQTPPPAPLQKPVVPKKIEEQPLKKEEKQNNALKKSMQRQQPASKIFEKIPQIMSIDSYISNKGLPFAEKINGYVKTAETDYPPSKMKLPWYCFYHYIPIVGEIVRCISPKYRIGMNWIPIAGWLDFVGTASLSKDFAKELALRKQIEFINNRIKEDGVKVTVNSTEHIPYTFLVHTLKGAIEKYIKWIKIKKK
ncbi:MAG: hypothetical protein AB1391_04435 [Candidatus Micrarchaeota archaeon]